METRINLKTSADLPACFFFSSVLFFSSLFYYYYFLLASPSLNRSLVCSFGRSFVCLLVNAFNKWACLTTYNIWKPMMMFVYFQYNFIARVAVSSVYRFSFSSFDSYMCGTINQIAGVFWTTSSSSYLYSLRMVGWLVGLSWSGGCCLINFILFVQCVTSYTLKETFFANLLLLLLIFVTALNDHIDLFWNIQEFFFLCICNRL